MFAALSILTLGFLAAGCKPSGSQPHGGMPPPEVAVITIAPAAVPASFEYVGQTAGSREVEVRARVTGILQKRNFIEGERVAQGQSLFSLDPAPFQSALAAAEAERAGAEARLTQAKHNAARLKPLYAAKAASQKEYDDAVSAEAIADAELKATRAKLDDAKLKLGYTRVIAPISGIAGRAQRSEGNYVTGPDVLLTSVIQIDPMYVLFGISDEERLKLKREVDAGRLTLPKDGRFAVTVKLADGRLYDKTGKLNFSDVRISAETGTSETRAVLPNPSSVLHPGQFVRVTLTGAQRPDAILVPQRAVLQGPQGRFVYVVNAQNQAEARPVTVGDWSGESWLIESGLQAGDKVIVDGVMKIGPGAPVRIADTNPAKK
ncbi:MAG: efflux RND transporter periplasmic adaptor subunit [Burkholderiales bacterium]|nr:efflux RND transporter periplasmic adaptor subunit [Burkholderiales bacterium]